MARKRCCLISVVPIITIAPSICWKVPFRYDGSSKFQPENRWAFYWVFSVGWRLSKKPSSEIEFPDELKLRASYGSVGNQSGIDRYDGAQLYNFKATQGALLGNGRVSYVDTNGKLPSFDRTWSVFIIII